MTTRTTARKRTGAGCLILMGLPFLAIGLGALVWGALTLLRWQGASDWVAVDAEVLSVALEEHRGDDSTTYETTATYRYGYGGQNYTGNRVALDSGSDNIGGFQQRLYGELRAAQDAGTPVTAYVDPNAPANAVLNRDVRVDMLVLQSVFTVLFGGLGVAILIGARFEAKRLAAERMLQSRFPGEPWRWRPEWTDGRIKGSTHTGAYVAIVIGVIWNVIAWPTAWLIGTEVANGNRAAALAFVFPLAGIGLAAWAIRAYLQLKRFKVATLVLERLPVAIGGRLKASVRVDAEVPTATDFRLELECVEERITGSGKNRRRQERLLWQKEWRVPRHHCQVSSMLTTIPVDVAVPAEMPTTEEGPPKIFWRLEVTGECPGPDFWSRFVLPVFAVGEQQLPGEAPSAAEPRLNVRPDGRALAALGIDHERLPQGGEAWTFRRGRQKRLATTVTALTVLWTVGCAVLLASKGPVIVAIVFVVVDALFVWYALWLWLTEYRVKLDRGVLTLTRTGPLPRATIEIPQQRLRGVRVRRGMQSGSKLYYDLEVETAEGKHTAASSLADYDVATWLARYWVQSDASGNA